jgi:hypothetical protein
VQRSILSWSSGDQPQAGRTPAIASLKSRLIDGQRNRDPNLAQRVVLGTPDHEVGS